MKTMVRENEPLDRALRRFTTAVVKEGTLRLARRRSRFESAGDKRRRKQRESRRRERRAAAKLNR
jgi:small subunit ribosomal protein S21